MLIAARPGDLCSLPNAGRSSARRRRSRALAWRQNRAPPTTTDAAAMLKFYYSLAPNPMKVALFLEEAGLPYEAIPVDTRKGEQHLRVFTALNPNAKVPVIVERHHHGVAAVLFCAWAEKDAQFLPAAQSRGALLSWMMFVASGIGPFTGQCVHFRRSRRSRCPTPPSAMTRGLAALEDHRCPPG